MSKFFFPFWIKPRPQENWIHYIKRAIRENVVGSACVHAYEENPKRVWIEINKERAIEITLKEYRKAGMAWRVKGGE